MCKCAQNKKSAGRENQPASDRMPHIGRIALHPSLDDSRSAVDSCVQRRLRRSKRNFGGGPFLCHPGSTASSGRILMHPATSILKLNT